MKISWKLKFYLYVRDFCAWQAEYDPDEWAELGRDCVLHQDWTKLQSWIGLDSPQALCNHINSSNLHPLKSISKNLCFKGKKLLIWKNYNKNKQSCKSSKIISLWILWVQNLDVPKLVSFLNTLLIVASCSKRHSKLICQRQTCPWHFAHFVDKSTKQNLCSRHEHSTFLQFNPLSFILGP